MWETVQQTITQMDLEQRVVQAMGKFKVFTKFNRKGIIYR